jgi:hypothetical protein
MMEGDPAIVGRQVGEEFRKRVAHRQLAARLEVEDRRRCEGLGDRGDVEQRVRAVRNSGFRYRRPEATAQQRTAVAHGEKRA